MILLQLSSGQGPEECARAVALALEHIQKQASLTNVDLDVIEATKGRHEQCYKSVLLKLSKEQSLALAQQWQGVMQWICESPFRPRHKRKNWFFNGCVYDADTQTMETVRETDIQFKTCKASGAGGQHVNTTDSAVHATHLPSGISVKVSSERSQHANKKLAKLLLAVKLTDAANLQSAEKEKARWSQHWQLQRGNPERVFVGKKFQANN